ncbi:MAG: alpha/beta hydrolase [Anaerolineae bacterium]
MQMLREQTFDAGLVTISYVEGPPSGPPLVLLHGGGDRWQCFLPIIPSLVMRWHVYALDLRGHGKSGRVPGHYRPEEYVPDIMAFLERQITERPILFGHSLGGWIALMVAAQVGDPVRALILGDPPLCMESWVAQEGSEASIELYRALRRLAGSGLAVPELASALADLPVAVPGQDASTRYGDLPGRDAAHLRGWAQTLSQVDPDAAQYHAEGRMDEYVRNVHLDAALRRLTCPVLLLQADVVTDSDAEHALSLLANGVHAKLEGIGHSLGLDTWNVAPLLRAVTDFLESL